MIQIIIVLLAMIIVAFLIVKGNKPELVLFIAGLVLGLIFYLGFGVPIISAQKSSGIKLLDGFLVIKDMMSSRVANLGLMIMALIGFAKYMDVIGANAAVVAIAIKPLARLKHPWVLIYSSYLLASLLQLAIPSATGLGVLLMGTMFPIMVGLGLSRPTSAAIIASSLAIAYTPTAIDAIRGSKAVGMDIVEYVLYHQGPPAILAVLVVGIVHIFWQKHCDKKEGEKSFEIAKAKALPKVPKCFAILPLLPIIFAILSSKLFAKLMQAKFGIDTNFHFDIVSIVFICMGISLIIRYIFIRDFKRLGNEFGEFLRAMGNTFSSVVCLLVAAGVFAYGIKESGAINILIMAAKDAGFASYILALIFAAITLVAAISMGSGNAAFLAFIELIPSIAKGLGIDPVAMILPMQQASHVGRTLSPVSGVIIAVSSEAKMSPFTIVKRTSIPCLCGALVNALAVGVIYYF